MRVQHAEEVLASLVENFIRERWVSVRDSTRKQQRTDHLAEHSDCLSATAFAHALSLFDDLGEQFEVRREPLRVRAACSVAEPAGVAYKTR